jgi:hypothetical protein
MTTNDAHDLCLHCGERTSEIAALRRRVAEHEASRPVANPSADNPYARGYMDGLQRAVSICEERAAKSAILIARYAAKNCAKTINASEIRGHSSDKNGGVLTCHKCGQWLGDGRHFLFDRSTNLCSCISHRTEITPSPPAEKRESGTP